MRMGNRMLKMNATAEVMMLPKEFSLMRTFSLGKARIM